MKKRIFICGNFGYRTNHFDGQTVKTRIIKDEIEKKVGVENVIFVDTSFIKTNTIKVFWKIFVGYFQSTHVIMLPDESALKVLLPFYSLGNLNKKKDMRYVVIGGWLPEFLESKVFYRKLVSRLDGVYVETTEMLKRLREQRLSNIKLQPNSRDFQIKKIGQYQFQQTETLKLVYFSRVLKEKGIELAIDAVNQLITEKGLQLTLDIYGPIQATYEDEFEKISAKFDDSIDYKGILSQNDIQNTLSKYDLMLFPTYFEKEGFPGAIIDAYISGVPILASRWLYNSEFVKEGITGKLFEDRNLEQIKKEIIHFYNNREVLTEMRKNCLSEAKKYHIDTVLMEMFKDMGI